MSISLKKLVPDACTAHRARRMRGWMRSGASSFGCSEPTSVRFFLPRSGIYQLAPSISPRVGDTLARIVRWPLRAVRTCMRWTRSTAETGRECSIRSIRYLHSWTVHPAASWAEQILVEKGCFSSASQRPACSVARLVAHVRTCNGSAAVKSAPCGGRCTRGFIYSRRLAAGVPGLTCSWT